MEIKNHWICPNCFSVEYDSTELIKYTKDYGQEPFEINICKGCSVIFKDHNLYNLITNIEKEIEAGIKGIFKNSCRNTKIKHSFIHGGINSIEK